MKAFDNIKKIFSPSTMIIILCAQYNLNIQPSYAAEQQSNDINQSKLQETCPLLGEKINKQLYVDALGHRVYVCCKAAKDALSQFKTIPCRLLTSFPLPSVQDLP
jgi:hypothetical protein